MSLKKLRRVSETAWVKQLASIDNQVTVSLGPAPGRMPTPPQWDTGQRSLDEHLVYFFAKEGGQAEIDAKSVACPRGSCCWITPGSTYRFFSREMPHVWRFRFSVAGGRRAVAIAPPRPFYFLQHTPAIAETIRALLEELHHRDQWQQAMQRVWLTQLSVLFFRRVPTDQTPRGLTLPQQRAISTLVENVAVNRWLTPRELAASAGLTLDYFSRVFQRTYGLAPRQWLLRHRLAHAAVLLEETSLRIGQIAQRLGYANPHLFSVQFSTHFGRSPRMFRQKRMTGDDRHSRDSRH